MFCTRNLDSGGNACCAFFREMAAIRRDLKAFYKSDSGDADPTIDIFAMHKRLTESNLNPDTLLDAVYAEIDSIMQEDKLERRTD